MHDMAALGVTSGSRPPYRRREAAGMQPLSLAVWGNRLRCFKNMKELRQPTETANPALLHAQAYTLSPDSVSFPKTCNSNSAT